jgi:hypothetical protein
MKRNILTALLTASVAVTFITSAARSEPKFECPSDSQTATFYINGVGFSTDHYQPRIHFRGQDKDNWAYLAYEQGVNTEYGKAILAVALTAYSTNALVRISCSAASVSTLWISDSGGKSPD